MAASTVILVALTLNCSYRVEAQESQHWRIGAPIATYWGGPAITDPAAQQMAEGGFNLVWCGTESGMDVASRHGLRVVFHLWDSPTWDFPIYEDKLFRAETLDDPAQLAKLDALIARVKNHPSLYAYFVADEPSAARFPALGRMVAHLRAQDPAHLAYINLNPTYAPSQAIGVKGERIAAYKEYVNQFIKIVKPELLSYDHYHFKVSGDGEWCGDEYFLNLGIIRQAALDAGIPFMNIVQACRFNESMRTPNGDEMRWLNYTSLAYGAQGLCYFMYSSPPNEKSQIIEKEGSGMMLRPDGSTTPQYEAAKALNPQFVAIASQLQPLRSVGVYHVGKMYAGTRALPVNAPFRLALAKEGDSPMPASGMLLGYFGKPDNSGKPCQPTHALVVNLNYRNAITKTVIGPGPLESFDAVQQTWKRASGPEITLALPPGGGTLVRVAE
jgi:hypothetical protein